VELPRAFLVSSECMDLHGPAVFSLGILIAATFALAALAFGILIAAALSLGILVAAAFAFAALAFGILIAAALSLGILVAAAFAFAAFSLGVLVPFVTAAVAFSGAEQIAAAERSHGKRACAGIRIRDACHCKRAGQCRTDCECDGFCEFSLRHFDLLPVVVGFVLHRESFPAERMY
jgi:hypothetical protein